MALRRCIERKSKPKRALTAAGAAIAMALVLMAWVLMRRSMQRRNAISGQPATV